MSTVGPGVCPVGLTGIFHPHYDRVLPKSKRYVHKSKHWTTLSRWNALIWVAVLCSQSVHALCLRCADWNGEGDCASSFFRQQDCRAHGANWQLSRITTSRTRRCWSSLQDWCGDLRMTDWLSQDQSTSPKHENHHSASFLLRCVSNSNLTCCLWFY